MSPSKHQPVIRVEMEVLSPELAASMGVDVNGHVLGMTVCGFLLAGLVISTRAGALFLFGQSSGHQQVL